MPSPVSTPTQERAAELEAVLAAWHSATDRLQETHETLRREVCRLTDELEVKNRELARKNRLADLGQMASHVAHEVRNSLVPLTLYTSLLRRGATERSGQSRTLDKLESGLTALEATVNDLLHFTSERDPARVRCNVSAVILETLAVLEHQLQAQGVRIERDMPDEVWVSADPQMLQRALLNLILNALDVMPDGGELSVTIWDGAESTEIELADSGPGIDPDHLPRLFEPFYSTKSGGTGLGLAIVERIASAHGGTVTAQNCPQGGAAFTLCLPRRRMEAAA